MKKIVYIVLLILSFTFNLYSQNNLKNILSELTVNGWSKRIDIRKINRQKYVLRKNIFQNIKKGKVVDIFYNKNKKSEFCLYYLNSFKEFDIYILSDITDIQMPINTIAYGGKNNFILFDNKTETIYHIESVNCNGSVFKISKNIIELKFSFSPVFPSIVRLDDKFMPISSIKNFSESDDVSNIKLSIYELKDNRYYKKYKIIDNKYKLVTLIPYNELVVLLKKNPNDFDKTEICEKKYCDSDFSRFFMK